MRRNNLKFLLLAFIAIICSFFLGFMIKDYFPGTTKSDTFYEVMENILDGHFKTPTEDELFEGAINGMIEELKDPHSAYFSLERYQEFEGGFEETYVGIGVSVLIIDENIVIEEVFAGSPAEEVGINPGDIIYSVDGVTSQESDTYELFNLIKGDVDTIVNIGVIRAGVEDFIFFDITRKEIEKSSVESDTFTSGDKKVGYLKVNVFGDETSEKFAQDLKLLEALEIEGLIIDLRNNGGGQLGTLNRMVENFILDDRPYMYTETFQDGKSYEEPYVTSNKEKKEYDIVVLVNEYSASASEVFAAAMKEHGNYNLLGTKTYGKGTMQRDLPLYSTKGDMLHLSIGKWYTPDKNWVHFDGGTDGIEPNILVEQNEAFYAYKIFIKDSPISFDTVSEDTKNLQIILNAIGYDVRTDGYYGDNTKQAIESIQSNASIIVTGNVDFETASIINTLYSEYKTDISNDNQLQSAIDYFND